MATQVFDTVSEDSDASGAPQTFDVATGCGSDTVDRKGALDQVERFDIPSSMESGDEGQDQEVAQAVHEIFGPDGEASHGVRFGLGGRGHGRCGGQGWSSGLR